jgi:hypothetical protein
MSTGHPSVASQASAPSRPAIERVMGAGLLLAMALIHLLVYVGFSLTPAYPGGLFLLNCVATLLLAIGIVRGLEPAWHLGAVLAAASIVLFVLIRTVGLPAFRLHDWIVFVGPLPLGPISLAVEVIFLGLYAAGRRAVHS